MTDDLAPHVCKHGCERDQLKDHIEGLEEEIRQLTHDAEWLNHRAMMFEEALRKIACRDDSGPCNCVNKDFCPYGVARDTLGEKKDG